VIAHRADCQTIEAEPEFGQADIRVLAGTISVRAAASSAIFAVAPVPHASVPAVTNKQPATNNARCVRVVIALRT